MKNALGVVDYSTLIQNALLSVSIVIGGVWAYYKFRRRKEVASLSVKIDKTELIKGINGPNFLSIEVLIINLGDREVKLYYNYNTKDSPSKFEEPNKHYKSEIFLYKVGDQEKLSLISNKVGITSAKNHYTGRLRSGVNIRLPYLFEVGEPGIYLIEFYINVNMKTYFKADDNNEKSVKIWGDRIFYSIPEFNSKKIKLQSNSL